jgi:hypothetical protein
MAAFRSVAPPKNPKTFFPKTRNPVLGTSDGRIPLCCTPKKTQNLFSENKKPRFGDIRAPICTHLHPFYNHGHNFVKMIFKITRSYMLSRKWLQKSSAIYLVPRVFAQKGFAISIFGHFFCPFSENFIESCRVKTKNNKIILQDLL